MKHRWGKGKKGNANSLPNGAKIEFVTVGGRTSAVVPSVQKKTGPVAGDVKKEIGYDNGVGAAESTDLDSKIEGAAISKSRKKNKAHIEGESPPQAVHKHVNGSKATNSPRGKKTNLEPAGDLTEPSKPPEKKRKAPSSDQTNGDAPKEGKTKRAKPAETKTPNEQPHGLRRSARVSGKDV